MPIMGTYCFVSQFWSVIETARAVKTIVLFLLLEEIRIEYTKWFDSSNIRKNFILFNLNLKRCDFNSDLVLIWIFYCNDWKPQTIATEPKEWPKNGTMLRRNKRSCLNPSCLKKSAVHYSMVLHHFYWLLSIRMYYPYGVFRRLWLLVWANWRPLF